jgi:hypothetical protein
MNDALEITRPGHFAEQIVIVDGQPGCGKTMLSPIVGAFDRVEILTYAYEMEYICELWYLGKITNDAAVTMVRMLTDLQLYHIRMSRGVNFRPGDMSSVFRDSNPMRYFRRLFDKGDENTPQKLAEERPILNLTTHNLLGMAEPVFDALGDRLVFIDVVRHPLYMIKQNVLNMERIIQKPRDFTIYFKNAKTKGQIAPFWSYGFEDVFVSANNTEKVIYTIQYLTDLRKKAKAKAEQKGATIITVPFENFVTFPDEYMARISKALKSDITSTTKAMLKKQNVPRKMYAQGIALKIYKRCGWTPPQTNSEEGEFELRWNDAAKGASSKALDVLEKICIAYEQDYLGGPKHYPKKRP